MVKTDVSTSNTASFRVFAGPRGGMWGYNSVENERWGTCPLCFEDCYPGGLGRPSYVRSVQIQRLLSKPGNGEG